MEMPELNEDILEVEPNSEAANQTEDSGNLEESTADSEDQVTMEVDSTPPKPVEIKSENEQDDEDTIEDAEMEKETESEGNVPQEELSRENLMDPEATEEPLKKKIKLEDEKSLASEPESDQPLEPEIEQEQPLKQSEPEVEPEQELREDSHSQPEELPEIMEIKKEEEEKEEAEKESEKQTSGPDTDMLATLASAALEQDPKDKTQAGIKKSAGMPKSPMVRQESETPKKKQEMWCNVGVFDTNTTIVSDYIGTPETNEHVDLVTATLGGRRIQLEPGTAYKFRVCAVNGCGTGPWSDVAAFKTTLPGFPGAPSAIKISKSPEGAHLTWEPPGGNSSEILEYAVYLAVRSASQGCQPVTTNQAQLAFVRVFCGPTNKCMVGTNSLQAAHIDTTTKPAIIFRIAARNSKGYGPATQVRWLQESQNGTTPGVKRAVKS